MKRELWTWLLLGGLLASTWLNVELAWRLDAPQPAVSPPQTAKLTQSQPEALPPDLVQRLGLTQEQCLMIEGCSRN